MQNRLPRDLPCIEQVAANKTCLHLLQMAVLAETSTRGRDRDVRRLEGEVDRHRRAVGVEGDHS